MANLQGVISNLAAAEGQIVSQMPATMNLATGMRGRFPPGTVFYPPIYTPAGKLPAFGPLIERTLQASSGATNVWLALETGEVITADPEVSGNTHGPSDDDRARTWRISHRADLTALPGGGMVGADMAAMRVLDEEWAAALPVSVMAAMSTAEPEAQVFLTAPTNSPFTYFFKTRRGDFGILQITGLGSNPPAVNIQYKLVQPTTNGNGDAPRPDAPIAAVTLSRPIPAVHANFQARLDAAAGITDFTGRDTALAGLAVDAARGGDAVIAKQALGRITDFTSRDNAAASTAREFLLEGQRASALDAATTMVDFTARDGTLAEVARDAAKSADGEMAKRALARITDFTSRDNAAMESARLLMKAGSGQDALAVARSITDFSRRDQALAELAK
jgi:hypothetical protein